MTTYHKVMLHLDCETVPDGEGGVASLRLRENSRCRFVRNTRCEPLVVTESIPFDLCVRVGNILIGQDDCSKRRVSGVGNQSVDSVREV